MDESGFSMVALSNRQEFVHIRGEKVGMFDQATGRGAWSREFGPALNQPVVQGDWIIPLHMYDSQIITYQVQGLGISGLPLVRSREVKSWLKLNRDISEDEGWPLFRLQVRDAVLMRGLQQNSLERSWGPDFISVLGNAGVGLPDALVSIEVRARLRFGYGTRSLLASGTHTAMDSGRAELVDVVLTVNRTLTMRREGTSCQCAALAEQGYRGEVEGEAFTDLSTRVRLGLSDLGRATVQSVSVRRMRCCYCES